MRERGSKRLEWGRLRGEIDMEQDVGRDTAWRTEGREQGNARNEQKGEMRKIRFEKQRWKERGRKQDQGRGGNGELVKKR